MAQLKQIAKAAQSTRADVGFPARELAATMTFVPLSPLGRDQRATAVGEAGQHEQNTAAADTSDDAQRTTLKRVALADDRHRIGKIPAMGSLSPLPSKSRCPRRRSMGRLGNAAAAGRGHTDHLPDILGETGSGEFRLGRVAKRHPRLARRIVGVGHEPASHGFDHLGADC
jgi:hypothetical protein